MTRPVRTIRGDSLIVGDLPSGCALCGKGSKMVLFVTGLCDSSCYYCPLSSEKSGQDVVFADEMPVNELDDILYEARAIGAEGAGMSGGDPLCTLEKTLDYISSMKSTYGKDFHIHLYTSQSDAREQVIQQLLDVGLDEIRFHPQANDWSGIEAAVRLGMSVGIEVPAIPDSEDRLKSIAMRAEKIGVSFMNINQLEASETNFQTLVSLGMKLTSLEGASIEGSATTAFNVLNWAAESLEKLTVHYCSARFKDAVQMRGRLERRLLRTKREFEEKDESEPLLILGIIRAQHGTILNIDRLTSIAGIIIDEFEVPANLMNIDTKRMRIEIAAWILEEIAEDLKGSLEQSSELEIGIAFEYPSWDRLQTMFDPI
ncbi:MAG: radical SAM protein [Candidatus Thorarchaeota archaeon]